MSVSGGSIDTRLRELEEQLTAGHETSARRRRRTRRIVRVAVMVALLVAAPVVVASDRFTDVPDSNTFHDQIGILATAGITRGCNPPTNTLYCPADPVRRDQMAAFLIRATGRQSQVPIGAIFEPADGSVVASTSVKTEGTAQVNGVATFNAIIDTGGAGATYPCSHLFYVSIDGTDLIDSQEAWGYILADTAPTSLVLENIVSSMTLVVGAGTHTVQLIHYGDPDGECAIRTHYGSLIASVVPFSGNATTPVEAVGGAGGPSKSANPSVLK